MPFIEVFLVFVEYKFFILFIDRIIGKMDIGIFNVRFFCFRVILCCKSS
jgi:hypothetical protein